MGVLTPLILLIINFIYPSELSVLLEISLLFTFLLSFGLTFHKLGTVEGGSSTHVPGLPIPDPKITVETLSCTPESRVNRFITLTLATF